MYCVAVFLNTAQPFKKVGHPSFVNKTHRSLWLFISLIFNNNISPRKLKVLRKISISYLNFCYSRPHLWLRVSWWTHTNIKKKYVIYILCNILHILYNIIIIIIIYNYNILHIYITYIYTYTCMYNILYDIYLYICILLPNK